MTSNYLFFDFNFSNLNDNIFKESIFKYKDKYKEYIYGDSVFEFKKNESFTNDTLTLFRIINTFYSNKKHTYLQKDENFESKSISDSDCKSVSDSESESDNDSSELLNEYSDEIYDILNNSDSDSILSFKEEDLYIEINDNESKAKKLIDNLDFKDIIVNEISKLINLLANIKLHLLSKEGKNTITLLNLLFKMIGKINDIEYIVSNNSNLLGEKEEYLKFILLIQNVSEYVNSHHVTFQHYSFKIKEIIENNSDINNIIPVIDGLKSNYESLINEERKFTHFKNVKVNQESNQIIEKISYLFKANIKDHEEILQKYTGKKFNYYHL